jgi:hypothetical protein
VVRPNAVAENNAIANTPASAVTVIGARARRSGVIPLPDTANARQQQQLRSCARDCGHRFGERLAAIATSVSGGVTHVLPLFPKTTFSPKTTGPAVLRSHQFLAAAEVL